MKNSISFLPLHHDLKEYEPMIELTIGRGTYRFAVLFVDQTFGTSDEPLLSLCDLLLTPRAVHCGESSVQYIRSPTQVVNVCIHHRAPPVTLN